MTRKPTEELGSSGERRHSEGLEPSGDPESSGDSKPSDATLDTRTALLRAGRAMFARRGYDGASIRAITEEAGANLASVTYHFGSKQALYREVLREALAPLVERVEAIAGGPGRSVERTEAVVRAFFAHLADNPDLPQLMLQEMAAGKNPPEPVERFLRSVSGSLARIVREGQALGEIRAGDPALLGLSCVIQPIHLTLVRHWLGFLRGVDPGEPAQRSSLVEHAVAFTRAGLTAPEEE
ncbi:MAG TPA: TetR/AcrR family transcriptional regulator [Longimicrobiales bacterium]|nr:TetR/AcrR family transcriptional regulator [Longimicrobiales bacterium]